MTPERWEQIERLYHAALESALEVRPAFLARACAGDESLRREVETLLASHDQVASFIEAPPADVAAGMMAEERARLMLGRTLGRYQLRSLLGAGGMGEVYRARDLRLDRDVAVKILPEHLAENADALRRFEREAKAVAALSHPNILAIHDFGSEQGVSYAVMELLEGETLRARLTRAALSWREAAEVGLAISEGLAAAHAKGIIHRDLKPENVFLTSSDGVKILDFGIARIKHVIRPDAETATSSLPRTTHPGAVIGTVGYMSPEQVRGETAEAASDLFSLGCVLHEMVAGQRPFARGNTMEALAAILRDEPPALTDRNVPAAYRRLIQHCLEKSPDARPQSALDVTAALRAVAGRSAGVTFTFPRPSLRPRPAVWLATAAVLLALSAPAYWLWTGRRGSSIDSLAVLPLVNASGDVEVEYLSDGITESLINSLSQLPQLKRVIARSTVFSYKNKEVDPRKVGQELNVRAVLTGKVSRQGDRLVIGAELVNAEDGSRLWGEQYQQTVDNTLAVQNEIARQISEHLRLRLTGEERQRLTKRNTDNPEAYQLYLKGRYYWNNWNGTDFRKGLEYFEKAIALDPSFALAYAGLADAYYGLSGQYMPSKDAMPRVKAAAKKALGVDETLGEAHISLAFAKGFYDWDWPEAEREFNRAIELNPNYGTAHWAYGFYLATMGRSDEALRELQLAQDLDPFSPSIAVTAAWPYYYALPSARRYDQAIAHLMKVASLNPNFAATHNLLGLAYEQKGLYLEAIAEFNQARQIEAPPYTLAFLGHAYAVAGKKSEARDLLAQVLEISKRDHISPIHVARLYAGLGEKEQAFIWLQSACEEKDEEVPLLRVDPRFDSLRSDPRFADLLRRMNLAP